MAEFLTIIIFAGVILVTALIFTVWLFATLFRATFHGLAAIFMPHRLPPMPMATSGLVCRNERCRAVNPGTAKFCRRCGWELPRAQHVSARRAAMW